MLFWKRQSWKIAFEALNTAAPPPPVAAACEVLFSKVQRRKVACEPPFRVTPPAMPLAVERPFRKHQVFEDHVAALRR